PCRTPARRADAFQNLYSVGTVQGNDPTRTSPPHQPDAGKRACGRRARARHPCRRPRRRWRGLSRGGALARILVKPAVDAKAEDIVRDLWLMEIESKSIS